MTKKISDIDRASLSEIYHLGFFMERTLNSITKTLNAILKRRGINLQCSQFVVLKYLYNNEGISQSKLAKLLDKDPAAINRTMNYLEQKGYLTKELLDRKTMGVYLTEKAFEIKTEIEEVSKEITDISFKGINDKQRKTGLAFVDKVYNNCVEYSLKKD